jgi:hypothetical protein
MPKVQGYAIWTDANGQVKETDTFTCSHCNSIQFIHKVEGMAKSDPGGFCRACTKSICGPCVDINRCIPYEKKMEELEKKIKASESKNKFLKSILG